ncbi:alpha/beta-hydrolase [Delitschia confertaspora ATCC 74209]|uniref:Carboxypeptidase n=1 Tax=Delitschia confertaspora ATCC 74209 TaxID=1513339 RepID=A0A9P4MXV1_9PLEO|nr:alpha/beta-hydrolase [Delitschia confertaspora ATCC 74209]
MKLSLSIFSGLFCASTALAATKPHPYLFNKRVQVKEPLVERYVPNQSFKHPELEKRASRWLTEKTKEFAVNGSAIPEVPWDIGESYAGLLPISDAEDETRKLFFWFFPSTDSDLHEEIVIWLNGGPGCSSLSGFLTENGPFTWMAGTAAPVQNPYSWTNLTNMIWIEQPVGVGYTQGTPNITDEVELAQEFIGFYKQFVDAFDAHGYKVYVTGESYAGYYVPYIADAFIGANDTNYYNLAGISINDPIIGDSVVQQQVVIFPFVEYWNNILYLNDTFMEQMRKRQAECGYTELIDTYFTFPPKEEPFPVLPDPFGYENETIICDMFDNLYSALIEVNPCFNLYHISETCPHPFSQLGIINSGDYTPPNTQVYFNRTDVQEALHAVVGTNWEQCSSRNVFGNGNDSSYAGDASPGPAVNGVLQRVIEYTNNTIVGSGNLDMILPTNGTLFALQNMTWNGAKGLSEYPNLPVYAPYHPEYNGGSLAGSGYQGYWTAERGLMFYTAQLAGHELPGYTPGVGYRMLEILLGRVANFSVEAPFTTQKGDFTGNGTIYRRSMQLPSMAF